MKMNPLTRLRLDSYRVTPAGQKLENFTVHVKGPFCSEGKVLHIRVIKKNMEDKND